MNSPQAEQTNQDNLRLQGACRPSTRQQRDDHYTMKIEKLGRFNEYSRGGLERATKIILAT